MNKEKFELKEEETSLPEVSLDIKDPIGDKNFMIKFEGKTEQECRTFNLAIRDVLRAENLSPFHQTGTTPFGENEPGYHAWEIWKDISKEAVERLLSKIKQRALEIWDEK